MNIQRLASVEGTEPCSQSLCELNARPQENGGRMSFSSDWNKGETSHHFLLQRPSQRPQHTGAASCHREVCHLSWVVMALRLMRTRWQCPLAQERRVHPGSGNCEVRSSQTFLKYFFAAWRNTQPQPWQRSPYAFSNVPQLFPALLYLPFGQAHGILLIISRHNFNSF